MWQLALFALGFAGVLYCLPRVPGPLDVAKRQWVPWSAAWCVWIGGGLALWYAGAFRGGVFQ